MPSKLIVVAGTGTEIGKTHVSVALLLAWGRLEAVRGVKPVETGVPPGEQGDDARRLEAASTFHVKHSGLTFVQPISPHLAAREEGRTIDPKSIVDDIASLRTQANVLVELAGGLFSPLGHRYSNADLARDLAPSALLLVAPDRLGVLHDIAASVRAAAAMNLAVTGIVLSAPPTRDTSTGRNAAEIVTVTDTPVLASLPRAPSEELASAADLTAALAALTR